MGLGDAIHEALKLVGVTPELVEKYAGVDCGCRDRQERLNRLGFWASRVLKKKIDRAREYLEEIIDDPAND